MDGIIGHAGNAQIRSVLSIVANSHLKNERHFDSKKAHGASSRTGADRRWTMKDITGLSKRLKNLERTISLSLLEKKTENFRVLDAEGFDRFKWRYDCCD